MKEKLLEEMIDFYIEALSDALFEKKEVTLTRKSEIDSDIMLMLNFENYRVKLALYYFSDDAFTIQKPLGGSYSFGENDVNRVIFRKSCKEMLDVFMPSYSALKEKYELNEMVSESETLKRRKVGI